MKFPVSMLREFVETQLSAEDLGDLLTMAGFELEGIEEVEGEPVLDVKVMSNRGDGLSIFGLAREVLAKDPDSRSTVLYDRAAKRFPMADAEFPDAAAKSSVRIVSDDCTRYAMRLFEDVQVTESPEWMQRRIRQAGWRPINAIVDATNYVLLELGQPLHAFDRALLAEGRIVVRSAHLGEKLVTLNDVEHELQPHHLVIADAEKAVAVAGVMGGKESEVTDRTTSVLLESAHFRNISIRRTRKELGLSTEASYRFERSVDPEGVVAALNRFAELMTLMEVRCRVIPGIVDRYPQPPEDREITARLSRTVKLLGLPIDASEAESYLRRLGFAVRALPEGSFAVKAPSWRPDIVREDDLIEEIGRVHGFDRIPEALPFGHTVQGGLPPRIAFEDQLRETLLRLGFDQIISHTLRSAHPLDAAHERIGPRAPGSPDIALLRNSIWPSLADAARRNAGRDLRLFELGRCFWSESGEPQERTHLGILLQGHLFPPNRANERVPWADFFAMKGVVESIAPTIELGEPDRTDARLHPTRQARIGELGIFGQIHPDIAERADLSADTILLELDAHALFAAQSEEIRYRPISRNPSVRRDLAIIVSKALPYAQIVNALELACGDLLERHWLFDVYEGAGIPDGKHSLAIALQLRKFGENFTDEEANQVREKAVAALAVLGATTRG